MDNKANKNIAAPKNTFKKFDKDKKFKGKKRGHGREQEKEFDQNLIEISRVTRVTAGGKRMRFRACIVIGDKKGRIGMGVMKGADVSIAVNKAVSKAKKNLINVKLINGTIPHEIKQKSGGAQILMKPAKEGTGVIAGGVLRSIAELAGIKNMVGKIQGSKSKINNVKAALDGLEGLRTDKEFNELRK